MERPSSFKSAGIFEETTPKQLDASMLQSEE